MVFVIRWRRRCNGNSWFLTSQYRESKAARDACITVVVDKFIASSARRWSHRSLKYTGRQTRWCNAPSTARRHAVYSNVVDVSVDPNHTDRSSGRSLVLGRSTPLVANARQRRIFARNGRIRWRTRRYPSRLTDYVKRASTGGLISHRSRRFVGKHTHTHTFASRNCVGAVRQSTHSNESRLVLSRPGSWIDLCSHSSRQ